MCRSKESRVWLQEKRKLALAAELPVPDLPLYGPDDSADLRICDIFLTMHNKVFG